MRNQNQDNPRHMALMIRVIAVMLFCTGWLVPGFVQANQAPLDTLETPVSRDQTLGSLTSQALGRSHLPAATATTVPRARAPRKPTRLDDPLEAQAHYNQARLAAQAGDPMAANLNLQAALEASASQPNIILWQGSHALQSLDAGTFFRTMPNFVRAMAHAPVARGRLLVKLQQMGVLLTAIFWSVFLIALYIANWRYLAHDWTAMLLRNRSHPSVSIFPIMLPLVLLAFWPGWLGYLAMASFPLMIRCRTHGRWILLATWLVTLVLVFPWWPALRHAVPTLDPNSEVVALNRGASSPPSKLLRNNLKARLDEAQDPSRRARLLTALGIQEARAGYYTTSSRHFDAALAIDPHSMPALVGKGNNLYYQGKLDNAMRVYQETVNSHPKSGEAHYNLAQVYFRKLFVPEATSELVQSRTLGYHPSIKVNTTRHKGYAPVVYPGLTGQDYAEACAAEAGNYPPQITLAGWLPILGAPGLPAYSLVGIPLLLAILIIMGWGADSGPKGCENCGVPLCSTCRKVRDGASMCAQCGEIAQRAQSDMILATLLKNRSRSEGMASTQRIMRWERFWPGTGHLTGGKFSAAWLRLSMIAGGLFLVVGGWAFSLTPTITTPALQLPSEMVNPTWCPLPLWLWEGWTSLPVLLGLAILALTWLITLTDGRRLHKAISERYSLIPVATGNDNIYPYRSKTV